MLGVPFFGTEAGLTGTTFTRTGDRGPAAAEQLLEKARIKPGKAG